MKHADFVHLHNHTQYSLLDGACRIEAMLDMAAHFKMPALAITDHGNLFGTIDFYKQAKAKGIKPIIGCEAYVAPESRFKKEPLRGFPDAGYHLILLVKNQTGYKNLVKLVTAGYLEGFYHRPRMDKELLKAHAEGLVALSSCLNGEVPAQLRNNDVKKAKEMAEEYLKIFGEGNFFIELQDHGLEEEAKIRRALAKVAGDLDISLVGTNDCHYLKREHAQAHDALLCIQTGKLLTDTDRLKYETDQIYFKSPAEMKALFADYPDAVEHTLRIAELCNLELELGKIHLPHFPLPHGFESNDQYLEYLARKGLTHRYSHVTPALEERLDYELKIIRQTGYAGYFLIVKDFIDYARHQNIPVGPGRGSAASSIVSYALGITSIDPIKYGLVFERFLNPERISMPDIDIDFADRDREKIIEYVTRKYGQANVSQIITFGTLAARGVIRDVGRVMALPYSEADRIAKLIPFEIDMTIDRALELEPDLKRLADSDPKVQKLLDFSRTLEGLTRHASTHAAGVVIAPTELTNYVPLYKTNKDEVITQFDMKGIEEIGLLKIDFLGLRTLTVIQETVRLVLEHHGLALDIENIPLDDQKVYDLFGRGDTVGLFQFESSGMRDYLRKLKPTGLEDLAAMNALYRPGPLDSFMVDEFIARKKGEKQIVYEHPLLEPILRETYGVIVYQEQVLRIASELAGYSPGKADILRKAMGKKIAELMQEQRAEFIAGARARGIRKETAEKTFELIATFGRYGFNKAHSVGYALLAYQTGYLKIHYPVEFTAASLTSEMGNTDRIVILMDECRRMGIEVLPPDVNESNATFSVVGNQIRFGLAAVKNVGENAVAAIVEARGKFGRFQTLFQFCERVDLAAINKRALESLIMAGACDSLKGHRAQLLLAIPDALGYGQLANEERKRGQTSLFAGGAKHTPVPEPRLPDAPEWSLAEILSKEKEMLGFYVSGHPLTKHQDHLRLYATHTSEALATVRDGQEVTVGGIVVAVKTNIDKKGKQMAFATLEDFAGTIETVIFADLYEKNKGLVRADQMILLRGRASTKEGEKAKVVAAEINPLDQAAIAIPLSLTLVLNDATVSETALDAIAPLLSQAQGPCPVILCFRHNGEEIRLRSKRYKVKASTELLQNLQEILGEEGVYFARPNRNSNH